MRLERLHVAQQHGAGQSWPGHQGSCQPTEAMLGMAVKAAATNTDRQGKSMVRKQLAFASQTPQKILEGYFLILWRKSPDSSSVQ